ncbi:unnamed protein product [Cochlearia groenlandica]
MGLSFVKLFSRLFAKKEMPILMDELRDTVLLVFANKQDLSNATNATEITDKLGLHSLRQRHWFVSFNIVIYYELSETGEVTLFECSFSDTFKARAPQAVSVSTKVLTGSLTTLLGKVSPLLIHKVY